jgi:hypothetical protein
LRTGPFSILLNDTFPVDTWYSSYKFFVENWENIWMIKSTEVETSPSVQQYIFMSLYTTFIFYDWYTFFL